MKNSKGSKCKHKLRDSIIEYMMKINLWEEELMGEIPTTFEKYGGLILFNSPSFSHSKWHEAGEDLWSLVCSLLNGDRIAIKGHIKDDTFRTPQVKLIYGKSSLVEFTDNGIKYRWDIEKTMFSRGNVTERHRIARLDCTNEVVVDLYAGIGYFTLPYLVHANAKHLHACEWNPDALESLRYNLSLNGVSERCTIYEGDNRLVCPKNIANRVNLGLIPSSEPSWEIACQALLSTGGILYVHQNIESKVCSSKIAHCDACANLKKTSPKLEGTATAAAKLVSRLEKDVIVSDSNNFSVTWKMPEWYSFSLHLSHKLLTFVESYHEGNWTVCVSEVFKVKSYAPHVDHIVLSVKCFPTTSQLLK
uniref:tRNA(Phe) (4-demethylwyosine(37)-C(7)) aminocarboxypropyltransferase n=1 Tax=Lygus hesperus TaxID=30085 RepID=A0A0A9WQ00_LYGHE